MNSSAPSNLIPIAELDDDLAARVGLTRPPGTDTLTVTEEPVMSSDLAVAAPHGDGLDVDFAFDLAIQYLEMAETIGRNEACVGFICQLRDDGCSESSARGAAIVFAEEAPPTNPSGVLAPFTEAEALRVVESVYSRAPREPWSTRTGLSRPSIQVNGRQLRHLGGDVHAALVDAAEELELFRSGNRLAQIRADDHGGHFVQPLDPTQLRNLATQAADFVRIESDGPEPEDIKITSAHPPVGAINDVAAMGDWPGIRTLTGITETPVVRPDATILTQPGYDPATRLVYAPTGTLCLPPVPEHPTAAEIAAARDLVLDLVSEFPFDGPASMANAVGLLLTPLVRPLIDGLVPMALVTAPQRGSGKTMLVKIAGILATGRGTPAMAWPRSEEEVEKRITAKLLTSDPLLLVDNLHDARAMTSPALDALLTTDMWEGRLLGRSEMIRVPNRLVVAATGNNLTIGGDLSRRSFPIRLDAQCAHPEDREFRRTDFERWVLAHRGDLLAAFFTLVRAWDGLDRPAPSSGVRLASYQSFVDTIGGILEVVGIEGFLDNRGEITDLADEETAEWAVLLSVLHTRSSGKTQTVAELREIIAVPAVAEVLPRSLAESLDRAPSTNSTGSLLGSQFRQRQDKRFSEDGLRIEKAGMDSTTGAVRWRIRTDDD